MRARRLAFSLCFSFAAAAALAGSIAHAQVATKTAATASPPKKPASAIAIVSEQIASALAGGPTRVLVAAAPFVSDTSAPRARELATTIARSIAGELDPAARAHDDFVTLPAARALARKETAIVYLSIVIHGGRLRVTADVYPIPRTVWMRARAPEPGPSAHAFAEAPIDAEVRTFLAPFPLVTVAFVDRAKNFESDVVALACGDVDGDGAPEIVSVSRRRVTTLRLRDRKVDIVRSRNWFDLAAASPAPLREPIAFASIVHPSLDEAGFVDVGVTDRAKSVRLDGALDLITSFNGLAVPDGDKSACTRVGGVVATGPIAPCSPGDPAPFAASVGGRYDAFASSAIVDQHGKSFVAWAGREDRDLELRDDAGRHVVTDIEVGAQLAIGDLDEDGNPDVIASLDTLDPLEDAVVVRSWTRDAPPSSRLKETLRIPAPAGVHALAVCPPDDEGRAPFVVATADEIWVVR